HTVFTGDCGAPGTQGLEAALCLGIEPRVGGAGTARPTATRGDGRLAPEHERDLALEHGTTLFRKHEGAVSFRVDGDQALGQKLTQHAAPALVGNIDTHAEHGQCVVPVLTHARCRLAAQDIDDMPRPVTLAALAPQPEYGGKELLRRHRAVP